MVARVVRTLSGRYKGLVPGADLKSASYNGGGLYFLEARRLVVVEGVWSRTK
jgi:hypothetical protein